MVSAGMPAKPLQQFDDGTVIQPRRVNEIFVESPLKQICPIRPETGQHPTRLQRRNIRLAEQPEQPGSLGGGPAAELVGILAESQTKPFRRELCVCAQPP